MNRLSVAILVFLLVTATASAQQSTELYIPIGDSPGVSGKETLVGRIENVNYASREMVVDGPDGPRTVKMSDSTRYYLDRTKRRQPNTMGDVEDCKERRRVEIRFAADGTVDWIKIESR